MATSPTSKPSVAVVGYGAISAAGHNCEEAYQSIKIGQVNNKLLSSFYFPAPFEAPCFCAKELHIKDYQVFQGKFNKLPFGENRTILLALSAIDEAITKAGLSLHELCTKRVGIALGTTVGCTFHNETYYVDWKNGNSPDPALLETYFSSNLAEYIQLILGVQGPRVVITNACASGTDAIGIAKNWLEYDLCDIAISGGVDELSRIACHGFRSLMLISDMSCKPFDKNRKGLNLGEGAGVFVLMSEQKAISDQREIFGWVRGYGIAGDAYHPTAPHPQGEGLRLAIGKSLDDASSALEKISMINAHGTGTQANDKAETKAIFEMGFDALSLPVVSTKGVTGHTLGAAGGLEAIFTLLALNGGELSGTVGCTESDPSLSFPVLKQGQSISLKSRIGISQSLAFGGSNSALVIEGSGT